MSLANMHFNQRVERSNITRDIAPILEMEFKDFYRLGQREKSSELKSYIDTLSVNVFNNKLSDKEFRLLAAQIIKNLSLKV